MTHKVEAEVEVELIKDGVAYILELNIQDTNNLVIKSVTRMRDEKDIDPETFQSTLNIDDWQSMQIQIEDK